MGTENRKSLEPWVYDTVEFYEHQVTGIRQFARMTSFLLADDMGLGKSLQALTTCAIDVVRETNGQRWAENIIVVCPVGLKANWAEEIEKFTRFPYLILGQEEHPTRHGIFRRLGPAERNDQIYEFGTWEGPKILIINYEQVDPHLRELNALHFDIAIYDEAHYIKNFEAKRTEAAMELRSKRSFLLTGTPMLNQVNELWPLLHKIDPAGYPRYFSFLNRYAVYGGYKNKQIVGVKNRKELTNRLKTVMVRRLKEDVLDLPDVQEIPRYIDLYPEQRELYDSASEDLQIQMADIDDPVEIENALVKFLRLKQICGTTWEFLGEDISSKLDLVIQDSLEILSNNHKLVVFTQFRSVMEMFCQRLDKAAPEFDIWEIHGDVKPNSRVPMIRDWTEHPKPAVICCMLQIAQGFNMTAARHAQRIDKLFVPGLNKQAIDRLHRIGADTTQPIQVFDYICRNTVEKRVEQILRQKLKVYADVVEDAVKTSDFKQRLVAELLRAEAEDAA